MITNQNSASYASLFATASQALKIENPAEYISSLNEYFSVIEQLAREDLKFNILPIDEETFDIDANTRTITVPPSFKNGVGVKGDQVAEIIYFKIDRYFDATDLNTQNIYIEWKNAKGEPGLSKEYVRDVTSDPDHIIFGWPLASQITEYAGAVEFAVRFYSFKDPAAADKEIVYSFATQPQTIMINDTMNFSIVDDRIQKLEDNIIQMIKERFQNSDRDDVTTNVPAPEFLLDLVNGVYDIHTDDGYDDNSNSYALRVQAVGSGYVSYVLKRAAVPGSGIWTDSPKENEVKTIYLQTTDTVRNPKKIYYTLVEKDGAKAYEIYTSEFDEDTNQGIYEEYCFAFITMPGDYIIEANNRVGISSEKLSSNCVTFPKPVAPVINVGTIGVTLDDNNSAQLEIEYEESRPIGVYTRNWIDANGTIPGTSDKDSITVTTDQEESYYYVTVTNKRNNESITSEEATYRVTKPAQTPIITSHTEGLQGANVGQSLTVQINIANVPMDNLYVRWYKSEDSTMSDNDTPIGEIVDIKDTGISTITPSESGYYYAKVELVRNVDSKTAVSGMWAVL